MAKTNSVCLCAEPDFCWFNATNEDGWKCLNCNALFNGEPAGFSPHLDRERIMDKCNSILLDLHEHDFVYVSNGSHGDWLCASVADRCTTEQRFDQYSIIQFFLDSMTPKHSDYWKEISEGILAGADPRDRCSFEGCNKLSTSMSSIAGGDWWYSCGIDHSQKEAA